MKKLLLHNINKSLQGKQVLNGCHMTFEKGKIYGLLGANGSKKTTLFKCISQELPMDDGALYMQVGNRIQPLLSRQIGYVYSTPLLPDFLTGYEYIRFYMDIHKQQIKRPLPIDTYLDMMNISKKDRHALIKSYSLGMKNKIQMLCFIITKPDIILLDEPLTSFDVVIANEIKKMVLEMKKDHIVILSTNILQTARDLCDEIVLLHNGKLELLQHKVLHEPNF